MGLWFAKLIAVSSSNKFMTVFGTVKQKYDELRNEIENALKELNIAIDWNSLSAGILSGELYKILKTFPAERRKLVLNNAEFIDRINDLSNKNKDQKISTIKWFGEQLKPEFLEVLKAYEKIEEDKEAKETAQKTIFRLTQRLMTSELSLYHNPILLRQPNFTKQELEGNFQPYRRPWRALVRITRVENNHLWVVLPGWDSEQEIPVSKDVFPDKLQKFINPDERFFAKVNIGADNQSELYFIDFEDKP